MKIPEKIKNTLRTLPDAPGCYLMRDRRGAIIYVGKAASLRKRVRSYFRESTLRRGSPKLRGMLKSVADLEIITVRNEAEAVLTESRLIKDYKPRYNVAFRDDKRFLLLTANPNEPFPAFHLCRIKRDDGGVYFGPYASSQSARVALDFVEKTFGLRKCSPRMPDEETYRHCINDIVRYCSAPCIGKVSRAQYGERFEEACAFLRGERPRYLKELKASMEERAASRDFEKAAALRDTFLLLCAAVRQRARIASTPELRAEEAAKGVKELRKILRLVRLPRVIEGYDISTISGTYSVAAMVCAIDGVPRRNRYRRFKIKTETALDDVGMMSEVIRRRFTRLIKEGIAFPDLVLVDGGIAQLRAASAELNNLGVKNVACAALAKRLEEIYVDGCRRPLRLPRDSRALQVLQRLRDEAHRFALTYHRRLRGQRIKDSIVDDIPGIGPVRKKQLLEYFGSARRMMNASEEEIAKIPGIGYKMAKTIKAGLSAGASSRTLARGMEEEGGNADHSSRTAS